MGRTIKVSLAQQNQLQKLSSSSHNSAPKAIWNSDDWFQQHVAGNSPEEQEKQRQQQQDQRVLREEAKV